MRAKPKYATRDPHDGPWTSCDTCGFIWSQSAMAFQSDYRGGAVPMDTRVLKCPKCIDALNYQRKLIVIPQDPPNFYNTRPEPYSIDEGSWLSTQDGRIILTEAGADIIVQIPDPATAGNTLYLSLVHPPLVGQLAWLGTGLYLDLIDVTGVSKLLLITGSAVRTNIASQLTTVGAFTINRSPIAITTSSLAQTNVLTLAFFDASTAGNQLVSGEIGVSSPYGITNGSLLLFDSGAIQMSLT